jgi:hypothetical protein
MDASTDSSLPAEFDPEALTSLDSGNDGFASAGAQNWGYARPHPRRRPAAQRVLALAVGNSANTVAPRGGEGKSDPALRSRKFRYGASPGDELIHPCETLLWPMFMVTDRE